VKFGINTFLWTANFGSDHFDLLGSIREHGFDGIEATLIHPTDFEASAIRRALEANDLACTVCSVLPRELSAISEDATIRAKTRTHLVDCIQVTAEVGSHILAGPLYSPVGFFTGTRRTPDEWKRAVEIYQSLEAELNSYDVQVCLEPLNRFETYFLNTTVDAIRFCDEVDSANVGILWDSFHANIEDKDLAATLRSTGRHLKHVDTCENDRGTPGSGHIDWDRIFLALNQLGYNRWLTIESFGFALGELSAAASIWRDLAARPESIAWDGIRFLSSHAAGAPIPDASVSSSPAPIP
jgi:D-psicose/D-tagatose/L-ribulose 3-epimerase